MAYFRRALREGGNAVRLRAMVGLAALYLGTDVEAIAGAYRHIRRRQEANELTGMQQGDGSMPWGMRATRPSVSGATDRHPR